MGTASAALKVKPLVDHSTLPGITTPLQVQITCGRLYAQVVLTVNATDRMPLVCPAAGAKVVGVMAVMLKVGSAGMAMLMGMEVPLEVVKV